MMDLAGALWGVLVPGTLTGVGLLLLALGRKKDGRPAPWQALVFAAAVFGGYWGLFELPPRPFGERILAGLDWSLWAILAAGILFSFLSQGPLARLVRVLLAGGAIVLVLQAMLRHHWSATQATFRIAGLVGLFALVSFSLERFGRKRPGASLPIVLQVLGTGLALAAGLSGSAKLGQTTGMLCACAGAAMTVAWIRRGHRLTDGSVALFTLGAVCLGICAHYFSELPGLDALLLAAASLGVWVPAPSALRERGAVVSALWPAAMVAIPVAIVVTRAVLAFEPDPYADYYGG